MHEIAAKEAVFHFNKKHITDPTIPMWVVKAKGESYYVNHVSCNVPWTTKETSDNPHTKGSIKIKHCLIKIDDDNCADITALTKTDLDRLLRRETIIRFITSSGAILRKTLTKLGLAYGKIRVFGGGCSTTWYVSEFYSEEDFSIFMLNWTGGNIRKLMENEEYYKYYDQEEIEDVDGYDVDEEYEDEFVDN